jgi:hypothetical protein
MHRPTQLWKGKLLTAEPAKQYSSETSTMSRSALQNSNDNCATTSTGTITDDGSCHTSSKDALDKAYRQQQNTTCKTDRVGQNQFNNNNNVLVVGYYGEALGACLL